MSEVTPPAYWRRRLVALLAFMVFSIESWRVIPVFKPWGLDLHNLHVFQVCSGGGSPYDIDPKTCGDVMARPMIYPPVMYHSFSWLRGMRFEAAVYVWACVMVVAVAAALFAWIRFVPRAPELRHGDRASLVVFGALLLLQFPFVFSLERGSTDAPAIVLWTAAAFFFERRRLALAGAAAGLATAYKLYPAFACAVVGLALVACAARKRGFTWGDVLRFGLGAAAAFVASNAVLADAPHYFFAILPRFAKIVTEPHVFSHSIPSFVGAEYPGFARALTLLLLGVWVWAAQAALASRAPLVFAGALAISTFGLGTSWDYNLTTAYPFLLLLFAEGLSARRLGLAAFGVFAICGDRAWFAGKDATFFTPHAHLALELAFLTVAALALARPRAAPAGDAATPS